MPSTSDTLLPTDSSVVDYVIEIPASTPGASIEFKAIEHPGTFFRVKESTGILNVSMDSNAPFGWDVGMAFRCSAGTYFRRLRIYNPSTTEALNCTVMVARGEVIDDRLNVVRTRVESLAPVIDGRSDGIGADTDPIALAAESGVSFDGVPPPGFLWRRSITVTNMDVSLPVYLRDQDGNVIGVIWPQTTQVYFISAVVEVFNPDLTTPVDVFIGEIWWEQPVQS